jgi:sialic acid synthase SpsE
LKAVRIGGRKIGDSYPAFIIAEMAWSHDGSVENAKKIIDAAADARADAVCFHITSMEDYMVPQYRTGKGRVSAGKETLPIYKYLSRINLAPAAWAELFPHAKKNRLLICTMCNDLPSIGLASDLKTDAYVVSPASLAEEDLVREVANKGKPVFLRMGGATMEEVERAISWIKEGGNEDIVLVYGFQSYPTKLEDMHLKFIPTLKQKFQVPIGFADHTDGGSDLALVIPLAALAFGANVIEKHLTHDRSLKGEDFESALDPPVFKKFVDDLREIEKAFGSPYIRPLSKAELEYREIARKRTVAARDIEKGEKITRDKLAFKRSDEGIFPNEIGRVLGKAVLKRINKNDPITPEKVR